MSRTSRKFCSILLMSVGVTLSALVDAAEPLKTQNVVFVMTDGLRWEEVFRGADERLVNKQHGRVRDLEEISRAFLGPSHESRREQLLPFFWQTLGRQGQIYGNRDKGSVARVTNGRNFSYPGYSESLCGYADPWVDSNKKRPNRNRTVLEWLYKKPRFDGKVAAFAAWDVFPYIFNRERCGFYVNAGYEPMLETPLTPQLEVLNVLKAELPRHWGGEPFDAITFRTAREYLRLHQPRVFFLSLGETDEWAHEGRYDEYLLSARRVDDYLKMLWDELQANPRYRGTTTLIVSTDHGRGGGLVEWKNHGEKTAGSDAIWMAVMGPDTPAMGERTATAAVTQSQLAATLAKFLGEDYKADVPQAAGPLADVFPANAR